MGQASGHGEGQPALALGDQFLHPLYHRFDTRHSGYDSAVNKLLVGSGVVSVALVGGLAAWLLRPVEPEPEPVVDHDTGMSIEQQKELMQHIGYLQQE
jgi:hypothetical protein